MNNLTRKQKVIFVLSFTVIFILGLIIGIVTEKWYYRKSIVYDKDGKIIADLSQNLRTENNISKEELEQLKSKIEKDEAEYGNNYRKFDYNPYIYKKEPDRIYFKSSKLDGFYKFEKADEDYPHLLEVSEDRMSYSVMDDYNLYCFTPDSISKMMTSGDNYIIFDYDNEGLSEDDEDYNKDLIFRFSENTRLYRLVTYLSYDKDLILKDELEKNEFASNTKISGYKYMTCFDDYAN